MSSSYLYCKISQPKLNNLKKKNESSLLLVLFTEWAQLASSHPLGPGDSRDRGTEGSFFCISGARTGLAGKDRLLSVHTRLASESSSV